MAQTPTRGPPSVASLPSATEAIAPSPTLARLSMLAERFSGFHVDLESEATAKKSDDEVRVQTIRDVVSKIEKNLTMGPDSPLTFVVHKCFPFSFSVEIKRRQEADRALQVLIDQRVNSLQEALEGDLKDKVLFELVLSCKLNFFLAEANFVCP